MSQILKVVKGKRKMSVTVDSTNVTAIAQSLLLFCAHSVKGTEQGLCRLVLTANLLMEVIINLLSTSWKPWPKQAMLSVLLLGGSWVGCNARTVQSLSLSVLDSLQDFWCWVIWNKFTRKQLLHPFYFLQCPLSMDVVLQVCRITICNVVCLSAKDTGYSVILLLLNKTDRQTAGVYPRKAKPKTLHADAALLPLGAVVLTYAELQVRG